MTINLQTSQPIEKSNLYDDFQDHVQYKVVYPKNGLRSYVDRILFFTITPGHRDFCMQPFPNGLVEWTIIHDAKEIEIETENCISTSSSYIVGLHDCKCLYQLKYSQTHKALSGTTIFFTLKGAWSLLALLPVQLKNEIWDTDLLGIAFKDISNKIRRSTDSHRCNQFVQQYLLARLQKHRRAMLRFGYPICSCLSTMERDFSVDKLVNEVGVSYRSLNRFFRRGIGVTPKEYLKIIRFDRVAQYMSLFPNYHWSDIVDQFGYYDQAHFIREFKQMLGQTPSEWMRISKGHFYFNRAFKLV